MTNEQLLEHAKKAREYANVDMSGFKVGAALLLKSGKVYHGCNIEDPSGIGITNVCAERCAIIKAISEGHTDFVKIATVGGPCSDPDSSCDKSSEGLRFCPPCGACRQYLNSWNPEIKVVLQDKEQIKEFALSELLPFSFNEEF